MATRWFCETKRTINEGRCIWDWHGADNSLPIYCDCPEIVEADAKSPHKTSEAMPCRWPVTPPREKFTLNPTSGMTEVSIPMAVAPDGERDAHVTSDNAAIEAAETAKLDNAWASARRKCDAFLDRRNVPTRHALLSALSAMEAYMAEHHAQSAAEVKRLQDVIATQIVRESEEMGLYDWVADMGAGH